MNFTPVKFQRDLDPLSAQKTHRRSHAYSKNSRKTRLVATMKTQCKYDSTRSKRTIFEKEGGYGAQSKQAVETPSVVVASWNLGSVAPL